LAPHAERDPTAQVEEEYETCPRGLRAYSNVMRYKRSGVGGGKLESEFSIVPQMVSDQAMRPETG
jgi:hypothetical protein